MPAARAVSLDNLRNVPKALLTESITRLDAERMDAICRALARATWLLTNHRSVARLSDLAGDTTRSRPYCAARPTERISDRPISPTLCVQERFSDSLSPTDRVLGRR
jgi:hypothetical protein